MANAVGPECAAAVNLLCMSVDENPFKQAAQLQQRSSPGTGPKEMSKVSLISASAGCMVQIPPRFEVPIELEYIYVYEISCSIHRINADGKGMTRISSGGNI